MTKKKEQKNEILEAVQTTVVEIQELLAKSGYGMEKAQHEEDPELEAAAQAAAADASQEAPEDLSDVMQEEDLDQAPAPEEAPAEGEEASSDDEMRMHAQELSDEELEMMLEILMSEKESRSAQPAPDEEMATDGMSLEKSEEKDRPTEKPPQEYSQKAESADMSKMAKSMESVTSALTSMAKQIEELKKSADESKKAASKASKVTTRPVDLNSMQVLEKSSGAPKMERLNKSETLDFALNKIRESNGSNPYFDRGVVSSITLAKTDDDLYAIQDELSRKGVEFPRL